MKTFSRAHTYFDGGMRSRMMIQDILRSLIKQEQDRASAPVSLATWKQTAVAPGKILPSKTGELLQISILEFAAGFIAWRNRKSGTHKVQRRFKVCVETTRNSLVRKGTKRKTPRAFRSRRFPEIEASLFRPSLQAENDVFVGKLVDLIQFNSRPRGWEDLTLIIPRPTSIERP
ncbi:hypothetical protein CLAIMM_06270 [Cladophialophora immunda]|nr:hypothetical protein CLAIMM_06270 [Cladophialophora immunda]